MTVYTILNNRIIGIRQEPSNYVLLANERSSPTPFELAIYDVGSDSVIEGITQEQIDARARRDIRFDKTNQVSHGVEVINGGDTFFFRRDDFVSFDVITSNIVGNINWFDVDDNEVSLTVARQNQIKTTLGTAFLAILNG